jgi:hypothetical protein
MIKEGDVIEWYESSSQDDPFAPLSRYIGEISVIYHDTIDVVLLRNVKDNIIKTNRIITLDKKKVTKCLQ